MKVDDENMKGDAYQMKFDKIEEGKRSGPLSGMPIAFREKFHRSISSFLKNDLPQHKTGEGWTYSVNDTDEGLSYHLHYFAKPSETSDYVGYMVVCRVGTYNLETKEKLPDDQDKVMVFKFVKVDDLLNESSE
jgi:hypothetical protein